MNPFFAKAKEFKTTVRQQVVVKVRSLGPSVQILNKNTNKNEDLILVVSVLL